MTIRLIAGLGNDDRSYLQTFHNVGSRAVELFAERRRWNWREKKMYYAAGDGNLSLARSSNERTSAPGRCCLWAFWLETSVMPRAFW